MKLKIIDGQTFIVRREGKREIVQTLDEMRAEAQELAQARDEITAMQKLAGEIEHQIQAAILNGEDASEYRKRIAAIRSEIARHEAAINGAYAAIQEAERMIDVHLAETIRQADQSRLNEVLTPFNKFLKEQN